jgi:hypothetical protein
MNVHKNNDKDWYGIDIDDCGEEEPPFPIAVTMNLCEMVPKQAWALPTPCCPCVLTDLFEHPAVAPHSTGHIARSVRGSIVWW